MHFLAKTSVYEVLKDQYFLCFIERLVFFRKIPVWNKLMFLLQFF